MGVPGSYVVRIYRRGFRTLFGVVEDTQSGGTRAFRSGEELVALLRSRIPVAPRTRNHGKSRSTP